MLVTHENIQPSQLMGGTDGFRDMIIPGADPTRLNPVTASRLTAAYIDTLPIPADEATIIVGGDTRLSTPPLEEAVVAAASSIGARAIRMGVAPTPAIQWAARETDAEVSVSVTASHNDAEDNGIKLMDGAEKPGPARIKDYSVRYWERVESGAPTPIENIEAVEDPSLLERYKQAVVDSIELEFGREKPLEGKIILVDGANGAAMSVTPEIMRRLGATVEEFACDGARPINENSGAAHLEGVKEYLSSGRGKELLRNPNFIGAVANDGDGDRLMGVGTRISAGGEVRFDDIDGNRMMEFIAENEPGVVGTWYTNDATVKRLRERGIDFEFCDNGDRYVTEKLRELGWKRGGEFTGHLIDLDWLSSGDGVRMAAWLASYAATRGKTFAELAEATPLMPEAMVKVKMGRNSGDELARPDVAEAIAVAEAELGGNGRFVIRQSGTEKGVYRIWAVGEAQDQIDELTRNIAGVMAFPKELSGILTELAIEDLDKDGRAALQEIIDRGYSIRLGLRAEDLEHVTEIAGQDGVVKYCPRDLLERFGNVAMAEKWHTKGRLFFQLAGQTGLAGYGWTGPEKTTELPETENTFAIRIHEDHGGQGLGALMTRVMVSATKLRSKGKIGLETWETNHAGKAYRKAGAQTVAMVPGRRLAGPGEEPDGGDGKITDTRVFMQFSE